MNKDIDAQFLCKDCERYNLCQYYERRKEDSYICKYFHLSAEPCDDAISRKSVIDVLIRNRVHFCDMVRITSELKELPPVTPKQETVTEFADRCRECGSMIGSKMKQNMGHWISSVNDNTCSICGEHSLTYWKSKFCPNCGAKMSENPTGSNSEEESEETE